ncbi:uncharacterized protein LOC142572908 isoform X1 [Dermacentor variabilis]|uniref:uncharacterized protein LOC142572908 isoform X1 n=2 Tax=Dermacentor variabilis TaxID=34621 RepID=UPI003F5BA20A
MTIYATVLGRTFYAELSMNAKVALVVLLVSLARFSNGKVTADSSPTEASLAKKTTSDVASSLLTRLVSDVMLNASEALRGSVSVHDQMDAVIKNVALRLNEMGYLLVKMGAALKVGGRRLKDDDDTLSIVLGPAKFRKQKASLWALDIAKLGNCTTEVRLTQITAKIINAYATRSRPSSIYKGADQIGDIVGSAGDSLEDVALRLASRRERGTAPLLPKPDMTDSSEALLQNIIDIIVKHGAH